MVTFSIVAAESQEVSACVSSQILCIASLKEVLEDASPHKTSVGMEFDGHSFRMNIFISE